MYLGEVFRDVQMWCLGTCLHDGLCRAMSTAGSDDLKGLFQPKLFYDYFILVRTLYMLPVHPLLHLHYLRPTSFYVPKGITRTEESNYYDHVGLYIHKEGTL